MRNSILFIIFLLYTISLNAQKLNVEEFVLKDADITARTHPRSDLNGVECALVKVSFAASGATFSGNIVGNIKYSTSEYYVYMPHGSKRLTIKLDGYLPLEVSFPDLGIKSLESKMVYQLTITSNKRSDLFDKFSADEIYEKIKKAQKKNEDITEIVESCIITADQGDVRAQNLVGIMFKKGIGVSKNYNEAVRYFKKAAEQGDATGQYNLGNMYNDGMGVSKDYYEAVRYFRKAAEQGDADAQGELGDKYYHGEGVDKNLPLAIEWYQKAAEQGDKYAKKQLKLTKKIYELEVYELELNEELGDHYVAKGNKQLAANYYRKCLNLDYYDGKKRVEKKLKDLGY